MMRSASELVSGVKSGVVDRW